MGKEVNLNEMKSETQKMFTEDQVKQEVQRALYQQGVIVENTRLVFDRAHLLIEWKKTIKNNIDLVKELDVHLITALLEDGRPEDTKNKES